MNKVLSKRKLLSLSFFIITGSTTVSQAETVVLTNAIPKSQNFGGFLASILLDYRQSSTSVKEIFIGTGGIFNNSTGQKSREKLAAKAFSGGVDFGYGYQWYRSYFGINIDLNLYNLIDSKNVNKCTNFDFTNHSLKIKRKYSFDAFLRYGYVFNCILPYLKIGLSVSRWRIKTNFPCLAQISALRINSKHHNTPTKIGFLVGGGIDIKYSQEIILGGYATYTQFNGFHYFHPRLEKAKIRPSDLSVGLKASYLF